MRWQLGLGGLLACLDEYAVAPGCPNRVHKLLKQATIGKARGLGARKVVANKPNENTPPPRAHQLAQTA
jgi:hypothetical protein